MKLGEKIRDELPPGKSGLMNKEKNFPEKSGLMKARKISPIRANHVCISGRDYRGWLHAGGGEPPQWPFQGGYGVREGT